MLPVGRGHGELWHGDKFLCEVEYSISPTLTFLSAGNIQRVELVVRDQACETMLIIAGLTLVLADGSHHRLPKPIDLVHGDGHLECFLTTDVADTE